MRKNYESIPDEELILRLRDGESEIMDYICDKYKNMVRSKAKSMFILGGDNDDLIQEGMLGLFKAVRDYDAGRDASFYTFVDLCVSRQMYTAVQASRRKKHGPLNSYISIYATASEQESGDSFPTLEEMISLDETSNPEQRMINRENLEKLEEMIENELSAFEKQVLDLYLTGMNYSQIAKVLGKDAKSTDNALQRMKSKLRKEIGNQYN